MNKKIEEVNQKWSAKLKFLENKYEKKIAELEQMNLNLLKQLDAASKNKSTEPTSQAHKMSDKQEK